jgi:hypothetical protein
MRRSTLLLLLLLLLCAHPVHAARVDFTGFESGSSIECSGTSSGTISFDTTTKYTGTYALRVNPTGSAVGYCGLGIISGTGIPTVGGSGTYWAVFRFLAAALPGGTEEIYELEGSGSVSKFSVRLTSTGKLQAYDSANAQLGSDSVATIAAGTWYLIGVKTGTGTTAAYEVTINGSVEFTGTGNLSATAHAQRVVGKRTNQNSQSVDFYYDDFVVDDTAYPSGRGIVALHPNANGSTMQWTAGTGASDYTQVSEVVPNTADYVQGSASNQVALFRFETLSASFTTPIGAVKAIERVAEVTATSSIYAVRIRSGSTNSDSSTADVGSTAFATRQRLLELDPATAAAWTVAGVNAVEAGGVDTTVAVRLRLAWVALMVEATAVTVTPTGRARVSTY